MSKDIYLPITSKNILLIIANVITWIIAWIIFGPAISNWWQLDHSDFYMSALSGSPSAQFSFRLYLVTQVTYMIVFCLAVGLITLLISKRISKYHFHTKQVTD